MPESSASQWQLSESNAIDKPGAKGQDKSASLEYHLNGHQHVQMGHMVGNRPHD